MNIGPTCSAPAGCCRLCGRAAIVAPSLGKPARVRLPLKLSDHLARGRFNRFLPSRGAEAIAILGPRMGEDNATAVVDDCAKSLGVESCGTVLSRPTLRSKTGDEEQRVRHRLPQLSELLGIR